MSAFRDLRAYLAGLGTTAMLGLGAAILLVTATSLVAFSSWSSLERSDGVGDLVLENAPASQRQAGPRPRPRAAGAARAAADSRAPAPASGASTGEPVSGGTEPLRPVPSTPRFDEVAPAPPVDAFQPVIPPPAGPSSPPPARRPAPAPLLRTVTEDLGTTTETLTTDLGGVVGQVSPELGETADDTGNLLGDVIRGLGDPY